MCGILAHISLTEQPADIGNFTAALDLQRHRGPNDSGVYQSNCVTLGHRRLSIIDLSRSAAQPMHSADLTISIVFNGEIYNFVELKTDLLNQGVEFSTKGDTEVLINLYLVYGISFLDRLNGMFSFVLYDKRKGEIFVVRDRLGIKPLYYHINESVLMFSSEIKSILALKTKKSELNPLAVSSYFSFRYPVLDDTFFSDIFSVPPGHYFRIKDGKVLKKQYWNLASYVNEQESDKGEDFYLKKILELLKSSIAYRQVSDVPVGAFLSGGVDSSAIVALMVKNYKEPVHTFTVGFREAGYNEFEYAKSVAKQFQTKHLEIVLRGKGYLDLIRELIHFKDAPLSVPNEVPLYVMSKELQKLVTVVLSGEGADEIFGGYGRIFQSAYEFEKLSKINKKSNQSIEEKEFLRKIKKKYGRSSFANQVDHFFTVYSYTPDHLKSDLLTDRAHNKKFTEKLKEKIAQYFAEVCDQPYVTKMMYAFEKMHLPGLLQRLDTSTMSASVEARVPFVDHRLVEFAFTIPPKYKLKWASNSLDENNLLLSEEISEVYDVPKYILKKTLEPFLDKSILYRKKVSFPVPLENWFGGAFQSYVTEVLSNVDLQEIVNTSKVQEILESPKLREDHALAMKIWMVINISLFMEGYGLFKSNNSQSVS